MFSSGTMIPPPRKKVFGQEAVLSDGPGTIGPIGLQH